MFVLVLSEAVLVPGRRTPIEVDTDLIRSQRWAMWRNAFGVQDVHTWNWRLVTLIGQLPGAFQTVRTGTALSDHTSALPVR